MGQIVLLPTNLSEMIPTNHLVRVVNRYIEQMDLAPLLVCYKGGGTSSYHPKMMLKVFAYAYTQKIYSSRRIAKALRESVPFMWLSGLNHPDFRTINRFRGVLLKGVIGEVFFALLKLLVAEGYVKLEDYFVDGTKVEANANRNTAVWAKNTQRYEKQLAEKVRQLMTQIEQIEREENERYGDKDLEEMGEKGPLDLQKLTESVEALNQQLQTSVEETVSEKCEVEPCETTPAQASEHPKLSAQIETHLAALQQTVKTHPKNNPLVKAVRTLAKDCLPRARKYEEQQQKLGERNSYSKTDKDATFMRMKEDHNRPGSQPKPAYNIQNGTENQFVVNYSVHQQAGDTNCLIPHLDQAKAGLERLPKKVGGDSAYGSEENYAYLEREKVGNYLKYNTFDREQKKRYVPNPYQAENMAYDPERDVFTCPAAKTMRYLHTDHSRTRNGFPVEQRVYTGENCQNCPLKEKCTRAANNRCIRISFRLRKYRQQAHENLLSDEGRRLR